MTTRTRGGGAGVAVDDADLVIDQLHAAEVRETAIKRLSQRAVQGVHRAVALAHSCAHLAADAELHRGLGRRRAVAVGLDVDVVVQQLEMRPEQCPATRCTNRSNDASAASNW